MKGVMVDVCLTWDQDTEGLYAPFLKCRLLCPSFIEAISQILSALYIILHKMIQAKID